MLEATFDLLVPIVVANIIDIGIKNGDTTYILTRFLILIGMAVLGLACSFTAQFFSAQTAIGTSAGLRKKLLAHIQGLSFCDLDKVYIKKAGQYTELKIARSQPFKEFVLAHIEGVNTFEDANLLKNKELYALREQIPLEEGDVFIVDLIGLPVINRDSGKVYGKIKDVIIGVATDIYEIETENGLAYMPVVDEFVKEVDTEKGVFVTPIEGMFNEI